MTSIMSLPRGEKFHADNAAYKLTRTPLAECTPKRMAQAMYHATFELYRVRRINRAKWHGVVKVWGAGILRFMSVELWTEDIAVIEERLERKLADREDFRANPLTFTPRKFIKRLWKGAVHVSDGRTRYSVAEPIAAPIPSAIVVYTTPVTYAPVQPMAIPTRLQRTQWIIDTLRQQSDLCAVHDLNTSIRIECKDTNRVAVENLIAPYADGITITWKLHTVNTFTGQIADSVAIKKAG